MDGTMKAAVFKDIEQIEIEEHPIPACPEDGLLVKVAFCGICGGDVRNYRNGLKGGVKNQIMGHEIAGEIVEVGSKVTKFKVGERVAMAPDVSCGQCYYCKRGLVNLCESHKMLGAHYPGGFAQYIALPGEVLMRGFVEPIPNDMSFEHAAFAETVSAVIACQEFNRVSLGDTVLIIGDGPVGCLHIEVARARGASRIIMLGRGKIELARSFAPDYLISNRDPQKASDEVRKICGSIGPDIAICAVPFTDAQEQAVELVRKRGRVVIYGGVPKNNEMSCLNSNIIHYNELMVLGAFSYPSTGLADAINAIHSSKISADKYINAKVALHNVVKGMELMKSGEALKVMVDPWME